MIEYQHKVRGQSPVAGDAETTPRKKSHYELYGGKSYREIFPEYVYRVLVCMRDV